MRVVVNIFLWLLAYLVSTLTTGFLINARRLGWLLYSIGDGEGIESVVPAPSFDEAQVFVLVVVVASALPFAVILSGVPEAFGIKPSRWRYAGFGGAAATCLLYIDYSTGGIIKFDLWAGLIVFWCVVGGFVMGHLRLGILRSWGNVPTSSNRSVGSE